MLKRGISVSYHEPYSKKIVFDLFFLITKIIKHKCGAVLDYRAASFNVCELISDHQELECL